MPIQSTHPEYEEHKELVERTEDAYEGDVKEYIPRLKGTTTKEHEEYTSRAAYYNVVERTLVALVGALTRKPHQLDGVYEDEPLIVGAESFAEFVQQCYASVLLGGRIGVMCDYSNEWDAPYLLKYNTENITNWSDDMIVLKEYYYAADPNDKYNTIERCRYRELFLDENGFYTVNIWEQEANADGSYTVTKRTKWYLADTIEPTYRGKRLEFIPFEIITPYDTSDDVCKPPLHVIADINIEHYKLATDIAHGAHFVALPTPVIIGELMSDAKEMAIGGKTIWQIQQGGDAKYLEFSGAGLSFLLELQREKETQMYNLGSRMLQYKAGVESSDALQIRLGAEGASLMAIAHSTQYGLTKILEAYNLWNGVSEGQVECVLNTDFSPVGMSSDTMRSLIEAYNQGVISLDTLMKRLYEGEIIDDVEDEKAALANETPAEPAAAVPTIIPASNEQV